MSLPPMNDHTHVVNNGKREVTIDELAQWQPGMDRLMAELGPRMHRLGYAGRAQNWALAAYYHRSVVKQLRLCAAARPRYADDIAGYIDAECERLREAIVAKDVGGFEAAYAELVDRGNHFHEVYNYGYIKWVLPSSPPDDLDLTAR